MAAVDANLDVIRQAHHQNNQRIALIEQRCAERGQAFSKFVEGSKTDSSGDGDVERKKG